MRRGRRADLRGLLRRRTGSPEAKLRLELVLETLCGKRTVLEAARELGLGEARVHRLRERVLEAGCQALEPRRRGRRPKESPVDAEELERLREENAALRRALRAAEVRAELAVVLPQLAKKNDTGPDPAAGKVATAALESREQFPRRKREWLARSRAVDFKRFVVLEGGRTREAARELRLSRRTLLYWERRLGEGAVLRGRPRRVLDPQSARRVEESIAEIGPTVGVEPLKARFPAASRRALREILLEYRACYAREHALEVEELTWLLPGAVWAMDHTEPPAETDGIAGPILEVRDLASAKVLLWRQARATAEEVRRVLEDLFQAEGVPLVLKSDNGSAFTSELLGEYLRSRGVLSLLSPPRRPRYNGAVEASMRWLKARTEHQARRLRAAAAWSPEVLERTREVVNDLPRTAKVVAPESLWESRPVLTEGFRNAFRETVERERAQLLREEGCEPGQHLARSDERRLNRQAITRALLAHGILHVRRKRIPLPIKSQKCAKIC